MTKVKTKEKSKTKKNTNKKTQVKNAQKTPVNEAKKSKRDKKPKKDDTFSDVRFMDDDGKVKEWTDSKTNAKSELEKHQTRKKTAIIMCSILGFFAVLYLGITWFFVSHFYYATTINDHDFGLKSVQQVEAYMAEHVTGYELTLNEIDGNVEIIRGSDIDTEYVKSDELSQLLKEQNPFLWPKAFWEKSTVTAKVGVQFDMTKLNMVIQGLQCMNPEGKVESISAYPKFDGEQYVVEPEVIGTQIDEATFKAKVDENINGLTPELDMAEAECYLKPKYISTSEEVVATTEELNQTAQATVTYQVDPQTEVVDAALISQWLTVDEDMNIQLDTDKIREYVETLASKYNTIGKTRTFTTRTGNTVEVKGGNFGWQLDRDKETETLIENIQAKEPVTREPVFSGRGSSHGIDNDYGSTYIEVNLTNQNMAFIQNGEVVMTSDIVTGLPSRGASTPQGSFRLTYKTRNAVLRAPLRPDGTREYETPVAFWMPFNGGIGFHDATWQSAFGGSRYMTHGSHGCVNMPRSKAEELYSLIQDDTPIICHY